ncbi:MAG: DUF3308 domain-containing protein [Flavobacteriales bacterium]|nr:MAG: DUF3308 domain-containing protein [Flavobacteriales bacterium]
MIALTTNALAGNKDRVGQAGGNQLLINPWGNSTGLANSNMASINGIESTFLNVAGLNFINKTEVVFVRSSYLTGSDISLNAFGLAQKIGETTTLGLTVMSMGFGDIAITTVDLPEGGIGTFSPSVMNLGLSLAKEFSNSIYGGFSIKVLSESIADAGASGVAIDMGIRYVTGEQDNLKFGISLKNVGPKMQFSGDGFATKVELNDDEITLEQRTEGFELPALLSIGVAYDYYLMATTDSATGEISSDHKITAAGTFLSNSFGKDQIKVGVEYGFKEMFIVRAGYTYEEGLNNNDVQDLTNAFSGPSAGFSIVVPFGSSGTKIGLDYSYRATKTFSGTHSLGLRINI